MTIDDIQYFKTKEGLEYIEKYKHLADDDLEMLAFSLVKKGVPHYPYLITLLKLRKKAKLKFSNADLMFFDSQSLEMATSQKVGEHIARRFNGMKKVVDLTCGIGGNTIFLAQITKVLAIDLEKNVIEMAKYNTEAYGVEKNVEFRVGNAFFNIDSDADAFFIDPMRTRSGETKTRSFLNSQPKIVELLPKIFTASKNVCIKVSPAFDYKEIEMLPERPEIEIVSENNENKVALLWFGDFKRNAKKATMFIGEKKIEAVDSEDDLEIPISEKARQYIYEPNKAIIKAHLIDEIAKKYSLSKLNKNIAFLTSDSLIKKSDGEFRTFKVKKYSPFSLKNLKKDLREMSINKISIVNRGTPIISEKLIQELKLKEGNEAVILLTKLKNDKNYYIITEKI